MLYRGNSITFGTVYAPFHPSLHPWGLTSWSSLMVRGFVGFVSIRRRWVLPPGTPPPSSPPPPKKIPHILLWKKTRCEELWLVTVPQMLYPPPLFPPLLMYTSLWLLRSLGAWTKSATKKVEKCQGCLASWAIIADQLIQARAACCRSAVL